MPMMKDSSRMSSAESPPDRSPSSRAIIVHPLFKKRHPIYQFFGSGTMFEKFHYVPIPGFPVPFVVQQNFESSKEHLGSVLWHAGTSAARYIASYLNNLDKHEAEEEESKQQTQETNEWKRPRQQRVLELGCGTAALASQCAALCGAQTFMTDLPEVLEWAKQNAKTNLANQLAWKQRQDGQATSQPPPLDTSSLSPRNIGPNLSAMVLRWGETSDLVEIQRALQEEEGDNNNNNNNNGGNPSSYFDIVVAAECLYATSDNPDLQSKLLETLKGLLSNGRTKVFFSYQLRTGDEKLFVEQVLPSVFPNYMVEEVNHRNDDSVMDTNVYSMLWFRPKDLDEN
ncbi:unnamed protein product [Cylindrotheca closterium]|uniref:Uncharacterized protein n=1 Tax=Cylindrotheca closterium TaxID=2856 RepID=A0AAD2FKQ8_9STRA|nr:unnamed protein product [Cylindrotheca closterium]